MILPSQDRPIIRKVSTAKIVSADVLPSGQPCNCNWACSKGGKSGEELCRACIEACLG